MKLKLTTNIGTVDNSRLGLEKTLEGETVTVDQKKADFLLAKGWAVSGDDKAKGAATPEGAVHPAPHEKIGGTKANDKL